MADTIDPKECFPKWMRKVDMIGDDDAINLRWQLVAKLSTSISGKLINFLIETSFELPNRANAGAAEFRQICASEFPDFECEEKTEEVRIICCGALAAMIYKGNDQSTPAALKIVCASALGSRAVASPVDLVERAHNHLVRASIAIADRPVIDPLLFQKQTFNSESVMKSAMTVAVGEAAPSVDVILTRIISVIGASLKHINTNIQMFASKTNRHMEAIDEEVDMLWWLFNGFDETSSRKFSDVPAAARPISLPKRLAELTGTLPGPRSLEALLIRAGIEAGEQFSIPDAVNACEISWLEKVTPTDGIDPLTQPIVMALARKLETQDDTSWIAGWAKATKMDAEKQLSGIGLAEQVYRELLLVGE